MDNRRKRGMPDRRKINISQPWERQWWQSAFGVSKVQLAKAVAAVGVEVKHVRAYFFGKRAVAPVVEPIPAPVKRKAKKNAKGKV